MGLVKKLLDGILAFIGSIFVFLGGLLSFKKSEYYMEMAEEGEGEGEKSTALPAVKTQLPAQTKAPEVAKPEPAKVQAGNTKSSQPAASAVSKTSAPAQSPVELNFATKYLVPTASGGRRRPGPSMNYFLEMAKRGR